LKNSRGEQSRKGENPFSNFTINEGKTNLDSIVPIYDPPFTDSKDVYRYISNNIENWIENALVVRKNQ
jgi:hypothetical protein